MILRRHRKPRASAEAVAAIAAANRSHARAVSALQDQESLEPAVREARELLEAHNEANHWQQWLFEVMAGRSRRPA